MDENDAKQAIFEYDSETIAEAYENDEPHDFIAEIADSNVDVYNYNLLQWLPDNYSLVEDAIAEFGFPNGSDGKPDMIKAIMQGQYYANEQTLWEVWEELKSEIEEALAGKEEPTTEDIVAVIETLKAKK